MSLSSLRRLNPYVSVLRAESNGLVALVKPTNMLCVPAQAKASGKKTRVIVDAPYDDEQECFDLGGSEKLYLLHRLDAATSGLLLMSTSKETARQVNRLFKQRLVQKEYKALVFCPPRWQGLLEEVVWSDDLPWRDKTVAAETVLVAGNRVVGTDPPTALLTLRPKTGFTHQLRIQCAKRLFPIVGDSRHGNFQLNRAFFSSRPQDDKEPGPSRRMFLHAESLSFRIGEQQLSFHAPLPPEFLQRGHDLE